MTTETPKILTKPVSISSGGLRAEGSISVHYYTSRERLRRAFKATYICLAVLLVCACIPGAHFILVPVGLLISPFIVLRSWRVLSVISTLEGRCAACQGELTRVNTRERYPLYENCTVCHRENVIKLES
jgi:hypothetical protein